MITIRTAITQSKIAISLLKSLHSTPRVDFIFEVLIKTQTHSNFDGLAVDVFTYDVWTF